MMKHQDTFDALKEALSTAPVLGYTDFSREFILEIDASLNGLGTVLSQQGKDREICCNSIGKPLLTSLRKIYVQL